eukprot:9433256-Pyramimonas_sp.AAC.1
MRGAGVTLSGPGGVRGACGRQMARPEGPRAGGRAGEGSVEPAWWEQPTFRSVLKPQDRCPTLVKNP